MIESIQEVVGLLLAARKEKKLSQRDLAKLARVPQSHISNIEKGKVDIRLSSLIEIARVLGMEPMLVPQAYMFAVKGLMASQNNTEKSMAALILENNDEDEND